MSLGFFLIISMGCTAVLSLFSRAIKSARSPFLSSLSGRLWEMGCTVTIMSFVFWAGIAAARLYCGGTFSFDTLTEIAKVQERIGTALEWLSGPFTLALISLILVVWTSLLAPGARLSAWGERTSHYFIRSVPWVNRLAVVAAFLSAFTFLNSSGTGVRLALDLQFVEVRVGAQSLDESIESYAARKSTSESLDNVLDSVSAENWKMIVIALDDMQGLEKSVTARRVSYEGITITKARELLRKQLHPDFGRTTLSPETASAKPTDEAFAKCTSKDLLEMTEAIDQAGYGTAAGARASELPAEIRESFIELGSKAIISKTGILAPTGNAIIDLFAEAMTETAIEQMRRRADRISSAVRGAIKSGWPDAGTGLTQFLKTSVDTTTRLVFAVNPWDSSRIQAFEDVQTDVEGLSSDLRKEANGVCLPPDVPLKCGEQGIPFCGPRNLDNTPC